MRDASGLHQPPECGVIQRAIRGARAPSGGPFRHRNASTLCSARRSCGRGNTSVAVNDDVLAPFIEVAAETSPPPSA